MEPVVAFTTVDRDDELRYGSLFEDGDHVVLGTVLTDLSHKLYELLVFDSFDLFRTFTHYH